MNEKDSEYIEDFYQILFFSHVSIIVNHREPRDGKKIRRGSSQFKNDMTPKICRHLKK